MCVNEQKLRKSSGLVKGRRPEVLDAWSEEPVGTWQERHLPQVPRMAGGLQQALLCLPRQGGLDSRTDESRSCQGASPGGCRRQETEAATRGRWAQQGWAGQAGVDTCSPGSLLCPHTDAIMLPLSLTLGLSPPFPGWGHIIGSRRKEDPGGKGERLITFEEVKPSGESPPVLPGNLCKLEIRRLCHGGEGRGLRVLQEAKCNVFLKEIFGALSSRAQASVSKAYVPDSDGKAHLTRVCPLQITSTFITPYGPCNCPIGERSASSHRRI